ncbi:MAG: AAA family ATPase [Anaerolineales bacterium]
MKIAVTGKGGVGKTTLTSLLAYAYVDSGYKVLAIDADPSPCLGAALGFSQDDLDQLTPIANMDELIYERTGAQPGTTGGFFKLNPRVDDLPDRFSIVQENIRLLELGAVEMGGSGCICPESAMLKTLVTHVLLRRDEVVLLDMYAGVEHLGRATASAVDAMLIVVEPTARSLGTANQIKSLAQDINLSQLYIVGSKIRDESDRDFIESNSPELDVIGYLPADERVIEADRSGVAIYKLSPEMAAEGANIAKSLIGDKG